MAERIFAFWKLSVVALVAILSACAASTDGPIGSSQEAIIGGAPDGNGHPNVGAVVLNFGPDRIVAGSGTLIHPQVLLTAAHVTARLEHEIAAGFFPPEVVSVTFAPDAFAPGAVHMPIAGLATFPGFQMNRDSGTIIQGDVGVVFLHAELTTGITPAELAPVGALTELEANTVDFVGYGVSESGPPGERRIGAAVVNGVTPTWLQINARRGGASPCFGDSGGPGLLSLGGASYVGAVASHGLTPDCDGVGRAQRVDLEPVQAWLDATIASL